jgi:hypothetical protein
LNEKQKNQLPRGLEYVLKDASVPRLKPFQHQINHGIMNKDSTGIDQNLIIFTQSSITIKPGENGSTLPATRKSLILPVSSNNARFYVFKQ